MTLEWRHRWKAGQQDRKEREGLKAQSRGPAEEEGTSSPLLRHHPRVGRDVLECVLRTQSLLQSSQVAFGTRLCSTSSSLNSRKRETASKVSVVRRQLARLETEDSQGPYPQVISPVTPSKFRGNSTSGLALNYSWVSNAL